MKKLLALLLAFAMVLCLCACDDGSEQNKDDDGGSSSKVTDGPTDPTDPTDPLDNRVALDVFAGVTVKFKSAINGFGESFDIEYDYTKVDYDKSNTDIKAFLEAIEFSADSYSKLSNGDKIVVNASWSKSTAETLGVKLLEETKEFTVEGMYEVYRTVEQMPKDLEEIDGIKEAILDEVDYYMDNYDWLEEYDISYRYYGIYSNDKAGNPYVSMIYITAVVNFDAADDTEDRTEMFLGYNYLYQQYWEMNMRPQGEQSDRVSETGELEQVGGAVKQEEFFLN